MGDSVKEGLLAAYRYLLKPLVRILLRHGISFGEFAEVVKGVYVEVALNDFKVPGKKGTRSRVAVMTGLTRKEVKRVIDEAALDTFEVKSNRNRITRVLVGWFTDPAFTGPYGLPLELKYETGKDDQSSFVDLVRRYSGDMSPRSMLDELLRVGAVTETEAGWYKVLRRDYIPEMLAPDNLERVGEVIHNFVDTVDVNLRKASPGSGRFERQVYSDHGIRKSDLPKFDNYIRSKCQALLEDIDNWLNKLDPPGKGDDPEEVIHTGVGIYHYISTAKDQRSFKEILQDEGLLREEQIADT